MKRLLLNITDEERIKLLNGYDALVGAAQGDHHEIISTILSSLTQQQKFEVLLGEDMTPLHYAALDSRTGDSVNAILSPLTPEQQLTLLHKKDNDGYTPVDFVQNEETRTQLREYEWKAEQWIRRK